MAEIFPRKSSPEELREANRELIRRYNEHLKRWTFQSETSTDALAFSQGDTQTSQQSQSLKYKRKRQS